MNKPSLSIIIVNWNSGEQIRDCILSIGVANQDDFVINEVFVIDNASSDESWLGLEQLGTSVRLIRNVENRGFGTACNQGAALATGDYFLFLNPDTRLFENSLGIPISFMSQSCNSSIGICGIRMVDLVEIADNRFAFEEQDPFNQFFGVFHFGDGARVR